VANIAPSKHSGLAGSCVALKNDSFFLSNGLPEHIHKDSLPTIWMMKALIRTRTPRVTTEMIPLESTNWRKANGNVTNPFH
jgi:hypothetical protein